MIRAWYLCPWVVRLVIAAFLASTLTQDLAWAQARGDGPAVCDLTGQWRSSFGVMELHQRSRSPAGAEVPAAPFTMPCSWAAISPERGASTAW